MAKPLLTELEVENIVIPVISGAAPFQIR